MTDQGRDKRNPFVAHAVVPLVAEMAIGSAATSLRTTSASPAYMSAMFGAEPSRADRLEAHALDLPDRAAGSTRMHRELLYGSRQAADFLKVGHVTKPR